MTAKKEAAPVYQTEGGGEGKATSTATISESYFTTVGGPIASVLSEGRENALAGHEIKRILKLRDGRDVTSLVEKERRAGCAICATCNSGRPGYYLPKTPAELEAYNRALRRRIKNVTATLDAMETALDSWTGQARLDLDETEGQL